MSQTILEILKVIFLGIVEGITEWLPISSTGHMLLVDSFLNLNASVSFKNMFFVVIQFGAILAVIVLFHDRILPFHVKDSKVTLRKDIISMWCKAAIACIPGTIAVLLFDDYIDTHFKTPPIISLMLVLYGIAFIITEKWNSTRIPHTNTVADISYSQALQIGLFQVLSIIPGTSRSGATIIGGLLLGISRTAAAEFTFFLAIPVMLGFSIIKLLQFGASFSLMEILLLLLGMLTAYTVSYFVIRFLLQYIKKHDFQIFGWYRIILGLLLLFYFLF